MEPHLLHLQKQSFNTSRLQDIRCLSDESRETIDSISPVLMEIKQGSQTNHAFMNKVGLDWSSLPLFWFSFYLIVHFSITRFVIGFKLSCLLFSFLPGSCVPSSVSPFFPSSIASFFSVRFYLSFLSLFPQFIQDHKPRPTNSTTDEHPSNSSQSSSSTSASVPTVEILSSKLFLPLPERRRLLAVLNSERNDRNNNVNETNASQEDISAASKLSEKLNQMSLHSSTTSTRYHSLSGARLGPSIRGLDRSGNHRIAEENESLAAEEDDVSEYTHDDALEEKENLTQSHLSKSGVDSVFSPLVPSRGKSMENGFSFARGLSDSSHQALASLSEADLGLNEASLANASAVESSFASASALRSSFASASAASFVSAHSMALPGTPPFAPQVPLNGLPTTRRWSSLGAKDEDGLAELSMSNIDDSDAFLSESVLGLNTP